MIEVVQVSDGWTWTMICPVGRVIAYTADRFASDREAYSAASAFRAGCWASAAQIDHRMGACL